MKYLDARVYMDTVLRELNSIHVRIGELRNYMVCAEPYISDDIYHSAMSYLSSLDSELFSFREDITDFLVEQCDTQQR